MPPLCWRFPRLLGAAGVLVVLCACRAAPDRWDIGTVHGASVRIRVPSNWNGTLVMVAGGYSPTPTTFRSDQPIPEFAQELLNQGYAYGETGYSSGGLAIGEAVADVRALRSHFTEKHGLPRRTFVIGESKGGLVALILMETVPSEFDGAMAISGLLSSAQGFLERAFDLLEAFERQFPAVLPSPAQVPPTYVADEQTVSRVFEALAANPSAASALREQVSVRRNEDLAELLAFHTDAIRDLQMRCGGNPFERRPRESTGVGGAPEVGSRSPQCLQSLPAPSGTLHHPFLAVDVEYDPVIPGWSASEYIALVRKTGREQLFARDVVPGEGHLNVPTADRMRAFASLVQWSVDGNRRSSP